MKRVMNEMNYSFSDKLCEKICRFRCENGLSVCIIPKDFSSSYAIYAVNCGSADSSYRIDGKVMSSPQGTAHFIEHKMFDMPDGKDAGTLFSSVGAYSNAYTSYDKTAYLFSTTENEMKALEILINFVNTPYFTEDSVLKEQGIIGEEIQMYEDDPYSRLTQNMLCAMYEKHGLRYDIAGSKASIKTITPNTLYSVYDAFYTPENSGLFLCGKFDPQKVKELCEKLCRDKKHLCAEKIAANENATVTQSRVSCKMEVSKPLFSIGVKDCRISAEPAERMKKSIGMEILTEIMFSKSSPFFTDIYGNGTISSDLGYWYEHNKSFSLISINGRSPEPQKVFDKFISYTDSLKRNGIDKSAFERCRKVIYSNFIRTFDSTDATANDLLDFEFDGEDIFSYAAEIEKTEYSYVNSLLCEMFKDEFYTISEVYPK